MSLAHLVDMINRGKRFPNLAGSSSPANRRTGLGKDNDLNVQKCMVGYLNSCSLWRVFSFSRMDQGVLVMSGCITLPVKDRVAQRRVGHR